jgi:hypothetical protein
VNGRRTGQTKYEEMRGKEGREKEREGRESRKKESALMR